MKIKQAKGGSKGVKEGNTAARPCLARGGVSHLAATWHHLSKWQFTEKQ